MESRKRIEEIECIRGTIVGQGAKQVNLDVGRIHGVQPAQAAVVVSNGGVIARVKVDQVQEKTSVAKVVNGKPLTGHEVVFRPPRPRHLTVEKDAKRGVLVKWKPIRNTKLARYVVYRKSNIDREWEVRKRLDGGEDRFVDKSVRPGREYAYRVTAVDQERLESLPSEIAVIAVKTK